MKNLPFLAALLLLAVIPGSRGSVVQSGPFAGFDLSKVSSDEGRVIQEASEDFSRVLSGLAPVHAKFFEAPFPDSDRRSHHLNYRGHLYSLSVYKMPISIGDESGVIYGPQVQFHSNFSKGYIPIVSQLRFYTRDELASLLKGDADWTAISTRVWKNPKK